MAVIFACGSADCARSSVSGVRGVVPEFLTPSLALHFAQAFGTYVGRGRVVVGRDIVQPVVDLAQATRESKQRLYARRHSDEVKAGKQAVVEKHASRKNWRMDGELKSKPRRDPSKRVAQTRTAPATPQMGFDF